MNMQPLLRRTPLLPGESLPSLLERLAQLNYYPHSRLIGQICHERTGRHGHPDHIARPKYAQTFFHLGQLTRISPEILFAASDHHFAPVLTRPGKEKAFMPWLDGTSKQVVTGGMVSHRIRTSSAAQFCPLCLKASSYHHLSWVPVASAICLQHKCLLVNRCPRCGRSVSVAEIVRRQCKVCEVDLVEAQVTSVADDAVGVRSQQVIQYWLSVAPIPRLSPDMPLPMHPPAVLYRLLDGLRLGLCACHTDWPNLPAPLAGLADQINETPNPRKRPSPANAYYMYRAAFQGMWPWPQGLYTFLDSYSQRNQDAQSSSSAPRRLGVLWRCWFRQGWRHSAFEFVQQRLVDYLLTRGLPLPNALVDQYLNVTWFVQKTGLWTEERTAQTLGISIQALRRFYYYDPLYLCRWSYCRNNRPLFERTKVLALKNAWQEGWPIRHVVLWLGLSKQEIVKLVVLGFLTVEYGLDHVLYTDWILNRHSVETFFDSVDRQLQVYQEDPRDLCSLHEAVQMTSYAGIDSVDWLKAVVDGVIQGYKREPNLRRLSFVCFPDSMILPFFERIHTNEDRSWAIPLPGDDVMGHSMTDSTCGQAWIRDKLQPAKVGAIG